MSDVVDLKEAEASVVDSVDPIKEMLKEASAREVITSSTSEDTALLAAEKKEVDELTKDLSSEDALKVEQYATQIDILDSKMVLTYGAGAQKSVADFSDSTLKSVKTKDMGEIGSMLTDVVTELRGFSIEEEKGGFLGLFKKSANQMASLKAKYDKAEVNVNNICKAMENHQLILLKDAEMLDMMYAENLSYFKELTLYIIAGKKKLLQAKSVELPKLLAKAKETGLQEDSQAAKDYAAMIERFEKKIYDLELSRNIAMQMAPQIRLIQQNDTVMAEKIQSTIVNTIPLWKSQMVIAIGINHSQDAARAQREVTDMTNELLKKNAETLKTATIESAKESERGIVDIETLTATNQTLIETLDEVMKIQQEGREKRAAAEVELARIETEMKEKILEISEASVKVD